MISDLHFFATYAMTGIIWIVQLVHYPSFAFVAPQNFVAFSAHHRLTIGSVVMPLMLLEAVTGVLILARFADKNQRALWIINFLLLIGVWACTFFVSVPLHDQLSRGFDAETVRQLVQTNWVRTALWTTRSAVLLFLLR